MERFVFRGTQAQFDRAAEDTVLLRYAKWHRPHLALYPLFPLALAAAGVYVVCSGGGPAGPLGIAAGVLFLAWFLWEEQTGQQIRRDLQALRKSRILAETAASRETETTAVFENGVCRCLLGGAELGIWNCAALRSAVESDRIWWLFRKDGVGFAFPKDCLTEGTEADFRIWLKTLTKRYHYRQEPEKFIKYLK